MLIQASQILQLDIPKNFKLHETKGEFTIKPGEVTKKSGKYSYDSFLDALNLTNSNCSLLSLYKKVFRFPYKGLPIQIETNATGEKNARLNN